MDTPPNWEASNGGMYLPMSILMGSTSTYERVGIFASCFALLLGVTPAAPGHKRWLRLRIVVFCVAGFFPQLYPGP